MVIDRQTLAANVLTPITPPVPCYGVVIGNATIDDVKVIDKSGTQAKYLVVAAGFEKELFNRGHYYFPREVAFYLLSVPGGDVTFEWI